MQLSWVLPYNILLKLTHFVFHPLSVIDCFELHRIKKVGKVSFFLLFPLFFLKTIITSALKALLSKQSRTVY